MERLLLQDISQEQAVAKAAAALLRGGIVIYPTETTYGLAVDATNPEAVQKLFAYKTQRDNKPISVLVTNISQAESLVELNNTARRVYDRFLPGPVTVVSVGKHVVAPGIESKTGTLGIRMSSHPVAAALAAACGVPITATSANASNQKRPYSVDDVLSALSQKQQDLIDVIIDAGTLPPNEPSTIVDTTLESFQVLRQGKVVFPEDQVVQTTSAEHTQAWAEQFIRKYKNTIGQRGILIALEGRMGAGKTQFVKGLAQGLGITEMVKSPSYILMNEYQFIAEGETLLFWHIDAWRVTNDEELQMLGIEKVLKNKGVIALEWANLHDSLLKTWAQDALVLQVQLLDGETGEDSRTISYKEWTA